MFALKSPPRGNNFRGQELQMASLWASPSSKTTIDQSIRDIETKIRERHRATARNKTMSLAVAASAAGAAGTSPMHQQQYFKMLAAGNDDLMFSTSVVAFTTIATTMKSVRFDRFGFRLGGVRGAMMRSGGGGAVGGGGGFDSETRTRGYHRALARRDNMRLQKWLAMKQRWLHVLQNRWQKLASRVRKGVPMALRGEMWCKFTGAQSRAQDKKCRDVYLALLHVESHLVPWEKAIMCEVTRIYSSHSWFSTHGGLAQRSLFRVLRSLSLHRADVGYNTSMGFLAAFFLLFMDEHHAFWVLDIMLSDSLPSWGHGGAGGSASDGIPRSTEFSRQPYGLHNLYADGVPKLLVHLQVLDTLLASAVDAELAAHFAGHGVHAHMWAFDWFSSMFTSSFPLEVTVRVIDVILFQGSWEVCYRTALAAVQSDRSKLLDCGSFHDIMARLNVLPARLEDGEILMNKAWGLKRVPKMSKLIAMERRAAELLISSSETRAIEGGGTTPSASSPVGSGLARLENVALEEGVQELDVRTAAE